MNPTDEHLVALAEDIMIEHGLDINDVLSLADDVSGMTRSSSYPLPGELPHPIHTSHPYITSTK